MSTKEEVRVVTNGRTGIDEVRTARGWLASAAEPAGTALWEFVEAEGPVEAARALKCGHGPGRDTLGSLLTAVDGQPPADRAAADLDEIARLDGRLVIPEDAEWPKAALAPLEAATMAGVPSMAPPLALWVRGPGRLDELLDRAVTVIGSRSSTPYGEHVAGDLGHGLAAAGWTVVSGGAFGIDAAAHRGALAVGSTVAVLAGGLGRPYPAAHTALFDRLARSGALISEWPPNAIPARHRFLLRNRVLAAVGLATVVVEAGVRSAALSTARQARTLGRSLLAVPGPVYSGESTGAHVLIRDGAGLVTSSADVLRVLNARDGRTAPA